MGFLDGQAVAGGHKHSDGNEVTGGITGALKGARDRVLAAAAGHIGGEFLAEFAPLLHGQAVERALCSVEGHLGRLGIGIDPEFGVAQQGKGCLLKDPLKTRCGAGVCRGGHPSQISLELLGGREQTHLDLGNGDRSLQAPVGIVPREAAAIGGGAAGAYGIHHQAQDSHQDKKSEQPTAKAEDGNDKGESEATAAVVTTSVVTTPVVAAAVGDRDVGAPGAARSSSVASSSASIAAR